MKAIVNIEFILSVLVFLTTISFVSIVIINNIPLLHQESVMDAAKAKVYSISYVLLFDEGEPKNWYEVETDDIARIGLSSGISYNLSKEKIERLESICDTNYEKVVGLLGDPKTNVIINMTHVDGTQVLYCKPPVKTEVNPELFLVRFASLDGTLVKMEISVI